MAKLNLGQHAKDFAGDQKTNALKVVTGTYHVVMTKFQRRTNAKGTPSIRYTAHVLKALEAEGAAAVGTVFRPDYWADFSKPGNAARLTFLLLANGCDESALNDIDPDDDGTLVKNTTGTPFACKIEVTSRPNEQNPSRPWVDVEIVTVKALSLEGRKRYTDAPDWKQIVGDPKDRVEEPYDGRTAANARGGNGGTRQTTTTRDDTGTAKGDPFTDDDIPF